MMLINVGKKYCLRGNVGFPFVNPTYEAAIALLQECVQLKIVLTESFYFVVDKLKSFLVKYLQLIDDIIPEIRIRGIWRPNPYRKKAKG